MMDYFNYFSLQVLTLTIFGFKLSPRFENLTNEINMKVAKVVEITIRAVITYDDEKYNLHQAADIICPDIAKEEGIYESKELIGNNDFDASYEPWVVE